MRCYRKRDPLEGIIMDILIVDGYNIIGAWPELSELKRKKILMLQEIA